MLRLLALLYGLLAAAVFAAVMLYLPIFLGYYVVPKTWRESIYTRTIANRYIPAIDSEAGGRADDALLINLGLLAMFAIPHSLMARAGFKRIWTKIIPQPVERSTYVIIAGLLLAVLYWFWKPIPEFVWPLEGTFLATTNTQARLVFQVFFWTGFAITVLSSLIVAPGELTGLRQTWHYFVGSRTRPRRCARRFSIELCGIPACLDCSSLSGPRRS
jgi:methanethiol S-methyltransferase